MQKIVLRFIYTFCVRWFLKLIVGVKFDKPVFLVGEKQFIIVANHNSHLDTMALLASVPGSIIHKVKPVAAADYFGKTKLTSRLSNFFVNALLIPRRRSSDPGTDPVHQMISALDKGFSLILFPEGTRGEPEKEQPLKPGIGLVLTQRPHVAYVPVYMKGMGKAMPKGDNLIVPYNSTLVYGRPTKIGGKKVDEILQQIERDFRNLKDGTYGNEKS